LGSRRLVHCGAPRRCGPPTGRSSSIKPLDRTLVAQSMSATVEMTNDHVPTCTHTPCSSPVGTRRHQGGVPHPRFVRGSPGRAPMTTLGPIAPCPQFYGKTLKRVWASTPLYFWVPFLRMGPFCHPESAADPMYLGEPTSAARRPRSAVVPADEPTIAIARTIQEYGASRRRPTPLATWTFMTPRIVRSIPSFSSAKYSRARHPTSSLRTR
jgi:hypothetical protein